MQKNVWFLGYKIFEGECNYKLHNIAFGHSLSVTGKQQYNYDTIPMGFY